MATAEELVRELEEARKRIHNLSTLGAVQATLGRRNAAEQHYGEVYQQLVVLGCRPQIRAKYRW